MEENQTETQTQATEEVSQPQTSQSNSGVSFPTVGQQKKSGGAKTLLTLGILALVAVLGYLIFRSTSGNAPEVSPTPVETIAPVEEPTSTSSPAASDKSKVKIEVQNGTGIAGEAAFLQAELKKLGYTTVSVGNASSQDNTKTTVTFAKSLSSSLVDELTKKLKELYKEVEVKTSSSSSIDVLIITGLRKGSTAKPSASATSKATTSPAATSTSSSSSSPTPTPVTAN
jgi:hypothetical protein